MAIFLAKSIHSQVMIERDYMLEHRFNLNQCRLFIQEKRSATGWDCHIQASRPSTSLLDLTDKLGFIRIG